MKKIFVTLHLILMLCFGVVMAQEKQIETKAGEDSTQSIRCLVITNSSHFAAIGGGDTPPLKEYVESYGGVECTLDIDIISLTVDKMLEYDVVWVFNFAEWTTHDDGVNGKMVSDLLGNYVNAGGTLLGAMHLDYTSEATEMGLETGVFIDDELSPFELTRTLTTTLMNMGEIEAPNHPIMKNVKNISTDVETMNVIAVREGSEVLAYWRESTSPLAAVKDRVVMLNLAPIARHLNIPNVQPAFFVYGDGALLISNSIKYLFNLTYPATTAKAVIDFEAESLLNGSNFDINLTWKNPTKSVDGKDLTKIDKIYIYRDGELHASLTTASEIEKQSYKDISVPAGKHTYSVICYSNELNGYESTKIEIFSGRDVPAKVSKLNLAPSGDNGKITFEAPIKGKFNGWIDKSSLKYKIVRKPGNTVIIDDLSETEYIDVTIPELARYSYVITPYTGDGNGVSSETSELMLHTGGDIWMGNSELIGCDLKFYDPSGADGNYENDGSIYTLTMRPENPETGERIRLNFESFDIKWFVGGYLRVFNGDKALPELEFQGSPFSGDFITEEMKQLVASAGNESGALTIVLETNDRTINSSAGWEATLVCEQVNEKDLSVSKIVGEMLPALNNQYTYTAVVENKGLTSIDSYDLTFYKSNDNLNTVIETRTINRALVVDATDTVIFTYTFAVADADKIGVFTSLAADTYAQNDTAKEELYIQFERTAYSVVSSEVLSETMLGPTILYFPHSATSTLYLAEEVGVSQGKINAIRYYVNFHKNTVYEHPIKVYLYEREEDLLEEKWEQYSDMTKVFDGEMTIRPGDDYVDIVFDDAFSYTGKNLVVHVEANSVKSYEFTEAYRVYTVPTMLRKLEYRGYTAFNPDNSEVRSTTILPWIGFIIDCKDAAHVYGTVTDLASGDAVDGALVNIDGLTFTQKTDKFGKYNFEGLNTGDLKFTFVKKNYTNKLATKTVVVENSYDLSVEMEKVPSVDISGVIVDNSGALVSGVSLSLTAKVESGNTDFYTALTNDKGEFIIPEVLIERDYNLNISKDLYTPIDIVFTVGTKDTSFGNILINQLAIPPLDVNSILAENKSVDITWKDPATLEFEHIVYDDGSIENAYSLKSTANGWFGNFISLKSSGFIQSVDLFGAVNLALEGAESTRPLTLDIFDRNHKLVYSSEPFLMPAEEWINIELPYVYTDGNFYAMVHWSPAADDELTHFLGADENGPYSNAEINFYSDGVNWGVVQTFSQVLPCALMIRPNVFLSGELDADNANEYKQDERVMAHSAAAVANFGGSVEVETSGSRQRKTSVPSSTLSDIKKLDAQFSVVRYNIEDVENEANWTELGDTENELWNDNTYSILPQGAYVYAVKASYGENLVSNYMPAHDIMYKDMLTEVTVGVSSNNTNLTLENAIVTLAADDGKAEHVYNATVNAEGTVVFVDVWKGTYSIFIQKSLYADFTATDIDLTTEDTYTLGDYELKEELKSPFNLEVYVDASVENSWNITWNKSVDIKDGFEGHTDFAINSPGKVNWSYKNLDNVRCYSINDIEYSGMGEPHAYQVFVPNKTTPASEDTRLTPYRGKKYLAAFSSPEAPNDKWLISPRLHFTGNFVFKFVARSLAVDYGFEKFQVGYSTTDDNVESFRWLQKGEFVSVDTKWTEYSYNVPSEARYVTIRSISNNIYVFMLDEVFIGNAEVGLDNVKEYNIYLDGELVTTTKDKNYIFTNVDNSKAHIAGIESVYETGTSERTLFPFNVGASNSELLNKSVDLYPNPAKDVITLTGLENTSKVYIYDMYGKVVKQIAVSNSEMEINISYLSAGAYIVHIHKNNTVVTKRLIKL